MKILVIDIETASIDIEKNHWSIENSLICDIGIAQLDLELKKIKPVFSQTFREDKTPDPKSWVFKNKIITYKDVVQSKHLNEVKKEIQKLFEAKLVTSWSHNFELTYLKQRIRCLKIPNLFWEPKITVTKFLVFSSFLNCACKLPSIEEICQHFNLNKKLNKSGRAIDDALLESELILKMTEKWPILKNDWKKYL